MNTERINEIAELQHAIASITHQLEYAALLDASGEAPLDKEWECKARYAMKDKEVRVAHLKELNKAEGQNFSRSITFKQLEAYRIAIAAIKTAQSKWSIGGQAISSILAELDIKLGEIAKQSDVESNYE